ncbi:Mechanosensitive channel MscK precursor [Planctomycetes bacterium Pla163]|uniref:Mechanosensitive channel MscK n=1 Tax=Rohdeia mirabilis TaxID=2528008 RepID=A0A518D241_9BACT|nr:Mechanosensitive channel MscK precursor [Planctomycetes bacterium Pla163]
MNSHFARVRRLGLVLLLALAAAPNAALVRAQDPPPAPTATSDSQLRLDELRAAIAAERTTLSSTATPPEAASALLDGAAREVEAATVEVAAAVEFRRLAETAAERIIALGDELARPPDTSEPPIPEGALLRDLEQLQQRAEADLVAARARLTELSDELNQRQRKLEQFPVELAELAEQRAEVELQLAQAAGGSGSDEFAAARSLALNAQALYLRARIDRIEAEAASYEARRDLLPLRRGRAQSDVARADLLAQLWQERASARRQAEAAEIVRVAEQRRAEASRAFEELGVIATRNAELAALRSGPDGIPARLDRAERDKRQLADLLVEIDRRSQATRRKVAVGGVTEGIGNLLRRDALWLPSNSDLNADAADRRRRLSRWQLLQIELEEERDEIGNVGARHQALMERMRSALGDQRADELEGIALELVRSQRELLDRSIGELGELLVALIEQGNRQERVVTGASEYRRYIDERILWFPSGSIDGPLDGKAHVEAITWLLAPATWTEYVRSVASGAVRLPSRAALAVLVLLVWLLLARRMRATILRLGQESRSFRTDGHLLTVKATTALLAVVVPLPVAVWAVASLARQDPDATAGSLAITAAFEHIALLMVALIGMRETARKRGIGETIFRWRASQLEIVRRWVLRLGPPYVLLAALAAAFDSVGKEAWSEGPGRIAFVASQVLMFVALRRSFRDLDLWTLESVDGSNPTQVRVRRFWMTLVLLGPIAWVGLSLLGYGYAAVQLNEYFRLSLVLGLVVTLASALFLRWLFVARRRLAVERAQSRAQARAEAQKEGEVSRELGALADEDLDLPAIDAQTRQFFRSLIIVGTVLGLYGIWSAGLPAIAVLDRVELWPNFGHISSEADSVEFAAAPTEVPNGSSEGAPATKDGGLPANPTTALLQGAGSAGSQTEAPQAESGAADAVTLADLLLALVVVVLTTVGAKNVPGLLEITLLKRLPLDSGARTALATLSRYLILMVGTSATFTALGISWEKIQWLAAALTFGLAFGLQEIFANFVSGIIILIERPIRVGDVVTVGGTEGRVTRLRMRATTILDWDRKELLVPNKEFITSSIVNWSLSDPVTRVIVPVGVAYGSDVELTHRLLMEVAQANDFVLKDPSPRVVFRTFGASSLDFELRVFCASRDIWPELIDTLHTQIDATFRKHDVEIAFPQQDLHIRSAPALEMFAPRDGGPGAGPRGARALDVDPPAND